MTISRVEISAQLILETFFPGRTLDVVGIDFHSDNVVGLQFNHFEDDIPAGDVRVMYRTLANVIGGGSATVLDKVEACDHPRAAPLFQGESARQITRLFEAVHERGGGFGVYVTPGGASPAYWIDLAHALYRGHGAKVHVGRCLEVGDAVVRFVPAHSWNRELVPGTKLVAFDIDHAVKLRNDDDRERFYRANAEAAHRIAMNIDGAGEATLKPTSQAARVAKILARDPVEVRSEGLRALLGVEKRSFEFSGTRDDRVIDTLLQAVEAGGVFEMSGQSFDVQIKSVELKQEGKSFYVLTATPQSVFASIVDAHDKTLIPNMRERAPKPANGELTKALKPEEKPERAQRDEAVHDAIRANTKPKDDRR